MGAAVGMAVGIGFRMKPLPLISPATPKFVSYTFIAVIFSPTAGSASFENETPPLFVR